MTARSVGCVFALILSVCAPALRAQPATTQQGAWDPVPRVDWSKIKLDDFADDELDLPYLLHHFHTVAEGVTETGANRGFMSIPVWRGRDKNQQGPWNARVMESHLSLAFFYATKRPWNPYFGSPAVRQRLEAMLAFWSDMQNADGRFSEYGPRQWNLPATAFATKFMGQTLTLLRRAGDEAPIDRALLKRVIEADRKAILATLTRDDLYAHGKRFTNQYLNVFAGAAAYCNLFPDDREIPPLMEKKFADAARDFVSPCGYFYEADGPDFGYTLNTTHSDLEMAYFYYRGQPIGGAIEKLEATWDAWLGYNLLRQPDGSTFVINRGCETRQKHADRPRQDGMFAETVESSRAFATTREEHAAFVKRTRAALAKQWGHFPELGPGKGGGAGGSSPYSPYAFLHREHKPYYPTAAERDAAVAKLPYLASDRFIKQLKDTRKPAVFTYVRRPTYYAAFNSGPQITKQQRLGLGMVWHPRAGALLQSQTDSADHAWGTRPEGAEQVLEARGVEATFSDDLTTATYPLDGGGRKTITFKETGIEVRVEAPGKFTEQIPVLVPESRAARFTIEIPHADRSRRRPGPKVFGASSVQTLVVPAVDSLVYELIIENP
jgi:hypothetical protein